MYVHHRVSGRPVNGRHTPFSMSVAGVRSKVDFDLAILLVVEYVHHRVSGRSKRSSNAISMSLAVCAES